VCTTAIINEQVGQAIGLARKQQAVALALGDETLKGNIPL
jgi:hypothetical protein